MKHISEFESSKEFVKFINQSFDSSKRWIIGGETGKNYWADSCFRPQEVEWEPDDTVLIELLAKIYPEFDKSQIEKLDQELLWIYSEEEDHSDYYGNWSIYAQKDLNLEYLYTSLKNLIPT